jgi:hypothetical protein
MEVNDLVTNTYYFIYIHLIIFIQYFIYFIFKVYEIFMDMLLIILNMIYFVVQMLTQKEYIHWEDL